MRRPDVAPSCTGNDYDEVIIVEEGYATCVAGDERREVKAGDVIVIPAGTPHSFINSGEQRLRQIAGLITQLDANEGANNA